MGAKGDSPVSAIEVSYLLAFTSLVSFTLTALSTADVPALALPIWSCCDKWGLPLTLTSACAPQQYHSIHTSSDSQPAALP